MVKELPYKTKTICQNQRMRLRYTHYSSRSAAKVGPRTHVVITLRKRPPKITTLCGNLSVCRRHNNILIAETMDLLINTLNNVLAERQEWCDRNLMVPHPEKCKAMILQWKSIFTGPIQVFRLNVNNIIKWTTPERLLGVQVDNKLSLSDHVANVAKSLASNSIRSFATTHAIPPSEDFYTKVVLPSVTYGLTVWGSSCNKTCIAQPILATTKNRDTGDK